MFEIFGEKLYNYNVISDENIAQFIEKPYVLEHKITKTRIGIFITKSDYEFMSLGVKTPIHNDKGIAHIIEHCILCGSEHYSLHEVQNLFLNEENDVLGSASVYSGLTQFTISSLNNHEEFIKGVKMCLDSVFYPRFLTNKTIFLQEGWHILRKENKYEYSGVVYNEMLSKMSNVQNQLFHIIQKNVWNKENVCLPGGIPDEIVTVKFDEILEYYRKYYKSSNMYFLFVIKENDVKRYLDILNQYIIKSFKNQILKEENLEVKSQRSEELSYLSCEEKNDIYFTANYCIDTSDYYSIYKYQIIKNVLVKGIKAFKYNREHVSDVDIEIWGNLYGNFPVLSLIIKCTIKEKNANDLLDMLIQFLYKYTSIQRLKASSEKLKNDFKIIIEKKDWKFISYVLFVYWLKTNHKDLHGLEFENAINQQLKVLLKKLSENSDYFQFLISAQRYKFFSKPYQRKKVKYDDKMLWEKSIKCDNLDHNEFCFSIAKDSLKLDYKAKLLRQYEYVNRNVVHLRLKTGGNVILRHWFNLSFLKEDEQKYAKFIVDLLNKMAIDKGVNRNIKFSLEIFSKVNISQVYICVKLNSASIDVTKFILESYSIIQRLYILTNEDIIIFLKENYKEQKINMKKNPHTYAAYRALSGCSVDAFIYENTHGINYIKSLRKELKVVINPINKIRRVLDKVISTSNLFITYASENSLEQDIKNTYDIVARTGKNFLQFGLCYMESSPIVLSHISEGIFYNINNYNVALATNLFRNNVDYDGRSKIIKKYINEEYFPEELRRKNGVYSYLCNVIPTNGNFYMLSICDPNIMETLELFMKIDVFFQKCTTKGLLNKKIQDLLKKENEFQNCIKEEEWVIRSIFSNITYDNVCEELDCIKHVSYNEIQQYANELTMALKKANICIIGNKEKIVESQEIIKNIEYLDM